MISETMRPDSASTAKGPASSTAVFSAVSLQSSRSSSAIVEPISQPSPSPAIFQSNRPSSFMVDPISQPSSSLALTSPITISSTESLTSGAAQLVVGSTTILLIQSSQTSKTSWFAEEPVATIPDSSSNPVVGSQSSANPPNIVSSTTASLPSGSTQLVPDSSTLPPVQQSQPSELPAFTVGSEPITADVSSNFVIGSQTLKPGGAALVLSGTTISLASNTLVVGSSTLVLVQSSHRSALPTLTIGSSVITANSNSIYVIGSQTLQLAGPVIPSSGTASNLAPGSSQLSQSSSTETPGADLGGYIWSGIGGAASSSIGQSSASVSGITSPVVLQVTSQPTTASSPAHGSAVSTSPVRSQASVTRTYKDFGFVGVCLACLALIWASYEAGWLDLMIVFLMIVLKVVTGQDSSNLVQ